jgi:two-component system OmpR family response regulator
MNKVLVVEDDHGIRQIIKHNLVRESFTVFEAEDGVEGLAVAQDSNPDLVILDVEMPKMDGIDFCLRLREFSTIPVIFLSGKKDEQDRIQGFAAGGDDYVTKPFSKRELVMKVQAMMKRAQQAPSSIVAENNNPEALSHHKIRMDLGQHRVFWEDQEISLTKNEFHILKVMLGDPSRVHPRDKLMDRVVEDRTIDSHVRGIRDKFKAFGVDPIETRRGVGFILKQWD